MTNFVMREREREGERERKFIDDQIDD